MSRGLTTMHTQTSRDYVVWFKRGSAILVLDSPQSNSFKHPISLVRRPPFNIQGGCVFWYGQFIYFNPELKISNCITCLYKTVLEVNYLFHALFIPPEILHFKKPPAPLVEIEWWPPYHAYSRHKHHVAENLGSILV